MKTADDYKPFMAEAIRLAERGRFQVCPNPTVGALLLDEAGQIVASGWHQSFGGPHAEIECLQDAASKNVSTAGKTMVVTLEPCNHQGKTPPCTDALLNAGIGRLVYGATDPNAQATGGLQKLAQAGVEVIGPVLKRQCEDLIADFRIWQTRNRPYVFLKLATTLDGRIATRTGHSQWISGELSRQSVHALRYGIGLANGAVLIGGGTFRADNPELTARTEQAGKQPLACVVTSRLPKSDADFQLLRNRPGDTIFFASPAAAASTTAESLRKLGCAIIAIGPGSHGGPDFATMLQYLWERNCYYVLCEGGGKLALSLLEAELTDEFHLYLAPMILGDNEARPLFDGRAPLSLEEALRMRICALGKSGEDAHLVLRPQA